MDTQNSRLLAASSDSQHHSWNDVGFLICGTRFPRTIEFRESNPNSVDQSFSSWDFSWKLSANEMKEIHQNLNCYQRFSEASTGSCQRFQPNKSYHPTWSHFFHTPKLYIRNVHQGFSKDEENMSSSGKATVSSRQHSLQVKHGILLDHLTNWLSQNWKSLYKKTWYPSLTVVLLWFVCAISCEKQHFVLLWFILASFSRLSRCLTLWLL